MDSSSPSMNKIIQITKAYDLAASGQGLFDAGLHFEGKKLESRAAELAPDEPDLWLKLAHMGQQSADQPLYRAACHKAIETSKGDYHFNYNLAAREELAGFALQLALPTQEIIAALHTAIKAGTKNEGLVFQALRYDLLSLDYANLALSVRAYQRLPDVLDGTRTAIQQIFINQLKKQLDEKETPGTIAKLYSVVLPCCPGQENNIASRTFIAELPLEQSLLIISAAEKQNAHNSKLAKMRAGLCLAMGRKEEARAATNLIAKTGRKALDEEVRRLAFVYSGNLTEEEETNMRRIRQAIR